MFVRFDTIPECDRRTDRTDGRTDGQGDGHLCCSYSSACIACYATALVKQLCGSDRCRTVSRPMYSLHSSVTLNINTVNARHWVTVLAFGNRIWHAKIMQTGKETIISNRSLTREMPGVD